MDGKETRKEFIFKMIKLLWKIDIDEESLKRDIFRFEQCDGIRCPEPGIPCEDCPFNGFWEGDKYEVL